MDNIKKLERLLSDKVFKRPVKLRFYCGVQPIEPNYGCIVELDNNKGMLVIPSFIDSSKADFLNATHIYLRIKAHSYQSTEGMYEPKTYDGFLTVTYTESVVGNYKYLFAEVKPFDERLRSFLFENGTGYYRDSISRVGIVYSGEEKSGYIVVDTGKRGGGYNTNLGFMFNEEGKLTWVKRFGKSTDPRWVEDKLITTNLKPW